MICLYQNVIFLKHFFIIFYIIKVCSQQQCPYLRLDKRTSTFYSKFMSKISQNFYMFLVQVYTSSNRSLQYVTQSNIFPVIVEMKIGKYFDEEIENIKILEKIVDLMEKIRII